MLTFFGFSQTLMRFLVTSQAWLQRQLCLTPELKRITFSTILALGQSPCPETKELHWPISRLSCRSDGIGTTLELCLAVWAELVEGAMVQPEDA